MLGCGAWWDLSISIHAPREGGDKRGKNTCALHKLFQSTPPARGATGIIEGVKTIWNISIHAPREGGDTKAAFSGA